MNRQRTGKKKVIQYKVFPAQTRAEEKKKKRQSATAVGEIPISVKLNPNLLVLESVLINAITPIFAREIVTYVSPVPSL